MKEFGLQYHSINFHGHLRFKLLTMKVLVIHLIDNILNK